MRGPRFARLSRRSGQPRFKSSRWRGGCRRCGNLFRFLLDERTRNDDPAICQGETRRSLPKVLSIADVDRYWLRENADRCRKTPPRSATRMRLYCLLECSTPRLRVSELCIALSARRDARMIVVPARAQ